MESTVIINSKYAVGKFVYIFYYKALPQKLKNFRAKSIQHIREYSRVYLIYFNYVN